MLAELLLLPILLYFSWEDIKTREVRDELVYLTFFLGIALNLWRAPELVLPVLLTTAASLILYITGTIALGDVWIAIIISTWAPETFYGVPLGALALLGGSILGALYGIVKVLRAHYQEAKQLLLDALSLAVPFSVHPILGIAFAIVKRAAGINPILSLLFLVLANEHTLALLPVYSFLFSLWAVLLLSLKHAKTTFTKEKEPEEGDIPAEIIDEGGQRWEVNALTLLKVKEGKIRPVHSMGADGLTKEDIRRLKELGIERIKVKESVPLIPFITASYILLLAFRYMS